MNNDLLRIKSAITNGRSISDSDYYKVMSASRVNDEDGKLAHSILRTYNYKSDRGEYKYLGDPFENVRSRDESGERAYGNLGMDIF